MAFVQPIQAMHTHGAMPDDGNEALFAVANLGFGVEAYQESTAADTAAKDNPPPEPKKRKDALTLLHMMQSRKNTY
jgi:hypothetical protein